MLSINHIRAFLFAVVFTSQTFKRHGCVVTKSMQHIFNLREIFICGTCIILPIIYWQIMWPASVSAHGRANHITWSFWNIIRKGAQKRRSQLNVSACFASNIRRQVICKINCAFWNWLFLGLLVPLIYELHSILWTCLYVLVRCLCCHIVISEVYFTWYYYNRLRLNRKWYVWLSVPRTHIWLIMPMLCTL